MASLAQRRIVVGVTGSIAAYKAAELARRLIAAGAEVQVVMTAAAQRFITSATLATVSGRPVRDSLWDESAELAMGHLELARWAELIVIAPASADTLARLAHGRADDLLSTLYLASPARVLAAPAMNHRMWTHAATRANVETLAARGIRFAGPDDGALAERESGPGRMAEPAAIIDAIESMRRAPGVAQDLAGKHVVVTAGPTHEPIDPVRYLGNRSSGRMGYALASAGARAGATVTLISGPTHLATPANVERVDVETAAEMHDAAMVAAAGAAVFIGAAAVADYRPAQAAADKLKKTADDRALTLTRTVDIIADVARAYPSLFTLGFAAETRDVASAARAKRADKNLSMVAGNRVGPEHAFGRDANALFLVWEGGERELATAPKSILAEQVITLIAEQIKAETTDEWPPLG